jgi:ribosomal protein S18 acetylase RimI-like enzyme
VAGWVRGSNRYAAEGAGYVASIGVLREHRSRGLARALLQARLADDAARGFERTLLHVDSESPTGATRLYEGVGMRVDVESVTFQRPLLDA